MSDWLDEEQEVEQAEEPKKEEAPAPKSKKGKAAKSKKTPKKFLKFKGKVE